MKIFYLSQGHLTINTPCIPATSAAFLHGESIFTSLLVNDRKIYNLNYHRERIQRGANELWGVDGGKLWDQSFALLHDKSSELKKEFGKKYFRARFTLYFDQKPEYLWSFQEFSLENQIRKVKTEVWEFQGPSFNFKSGDYAKAFSLLKKAKSEQYDDFIKINSQDEVFELTTSNILILKENKIISPPVTSNCLQGTSIQFIKKHFPLIEKKIFISDLFEASCVLGVNAVQGPFVISHVDKKLLPYSKRDSDDFFEKFKEQTRLTAVELC